MPIFTIPAVSEFSLDSDLELAMASSSNTTVHVGLPELKAVEIVLVWEMVRGREVYSFVRD